MKLEIRSPEIISIEDYKQTDIETIFTNKGNKSVAVIEPDYALVFGFDQNEKEDWEPLDIGA